MSTTEAYEESYYYTQQHRATSLPGGSTQPCRQGAGASFHLSKQLEGLVPFLNKMPVSLVALNSSAELIWANLRFLSLSDGEGGIFEGLARWAAFPDKSCGRVREWLGSGAYAKQEEIEVQMRNLAGEERRVRLRHLPSLPSPGVDMVFLLSVESISEPQDEAAHRALKEARKSREEQQMFLASMSHEIRNSANVIAGIVHTFREGYLSGKELQHLQYSTELLLHLTENLLYYSKIQENKFQLAPCPFNLQDLLSSLAQVPVVLLRHSSNRPDFECYQDPALPLHCVGDKSAIYQIILNLLSNALKFTREGCVELSVKAAGKDSRGRALVQFLVKDTGAGIPEQQLEAIFGPFHQWKGHGIEHPEGHGLGLAISRQLAELMDGRITVRSKLGEGSCFEVMIPLEEAAPVPPVRSFSLHCTSPLRVLLLEDDPLSLSYLESFLEGEGVAYHSCSNGHEALHVLQNHTFDLAMLDIQTPLLNGLDVAANLRNDTGNPNRNIPLLALSGSDLSAVGPDLAKAGIGHFLSKPYCPDQLKHWLWQNSPRRQAPTQDVFHFSPGFGQEELQTLYQGNYRQMQGMFDAFLRNIPRYIRLMSDMLERENWQELAGYAHKARPSFCLVGWRPVAHLARQVEEACLGQTDKAWIEGIFQNFKAAACEVLEAVDRENQRLISFRNNNTPPKNAYPDR